MKDPIHVSCECHWPLKYSKSKFIELTMEALEVRER